MSWRRRQVLAGALAGGGMLALLTACASLPNPPAEEPALARETITLPEVDGRARALTMWTPPDPRGVALFSTGWGARPERYEPLIERLGGMGLAIIAPLHRDPAGGGSAPSQDASEERIADLAASASFAQQRFKGLPVLAVGHSFGSLTAMALGGALAEAGTFSEPTPRGVIAFSSPGSLGGLMPPDTFSELGVPLLLLAGGAGTPGAVSGSTEQLLPPANSSADSYALVLAGAGPDFIDDAAFVERAWPVIDLFVQAYLFDIFTAGDVLESWPATGQDRFIVRQGRE